MDVGTLACTILAVLTAVGLALFAWVLCAIAGRADQWREEHTGERRS